MHHQNPPDYETRPLFHRARDLKGIYNDMAPIPGEVVTSEAAARQKGGVEADAQTFEDTRFRSPTPGNRQMAGLWRSLPRTHPHRLASPGEMEE